MHLVGLIPARYAASRFPGKPLTLLNGHPMLAWVLRGCRESTLVREWIVATDDPRIAAVAEAEGVRAVLTDPALPSGTDRIWAAGHALEAEGFCNVQGDEPLITGALVDSLARTLMESGAETATLARRFGADEDPTDPNRVKVVRDDLGRALYFSRALIPYPRTPRASGSDFPLLHLGLYAYTRTALERWVALPPHPLELTEGLEQLRALAAGMSMAVEVVDTRLLSVDAPEDVAAVEAALPAQF